MGWLGRKTSVGTLKSDIKEATGLPLDQRLKLASEMEGFIEEIRSVMQTPDHPSELMRLFQLHGTNRKLQVPGGFSALWAHHAFRESYLLALIKAPDDPKWFKEVHTLLHGIRGPLGLVGIESPPQKSDPGRVEKKAAPKLDGPYEYYHKNGQLMWKSTYVAGEVSGREYYYENGQLEEKGNYVAGELDGPYEYYHENGQLMWKSTYTAGKLDGPCEYYYENGQLEEKGNYVAGELDGPCEYYHENGQLKKKTTYTAGKLDGPYEYYHENGQLEVKSTYVAGERDGPYEYYHENGQLEEKGNYVAGELNGPCERYDEDGELREKGTYNMGWLQKCGEWIEDGETVTYDPCPPGLEDGN